MEIKKLKEFAKEVGIKPLEAAKMDEETLIKEIIVKVSNDNSYSEEFVAWYDNVPDKYFDEVETTDIGGEVQSRLEELIEIINATTKIDELKEIALDDDFIDELFADLKVDEYKTGKALKAAMLECIENADDNLNQSDDNEIDEDTKTEMIEVLLSITTEEEMVEFISDETVEIFFADKLNIGDEIDVEDIKQQMLNVLEYEEPVSAPEPVKEEKPISLKDKLKKKTEVKDDTVIDYDPDNFDPDEVYNKVIELGFPQLRKFAKQIGVVAPPGVKKDEILELVADKLGSDTDKQVEQAEEKTEVKVTKSMVKDAIDNDDKETLLAMCEGFNIELSALQKKSSKLMGIKLLAVVPNDDVKTNKPEPKKEKPMVKPEPVKEEEKMTIGESKSIYQLMEEMVLNEATEEDIIKEVTPIYKEKGKTILFVKKRVKQMIEIIKGDNDLK